MLEASLTVSDLRPELAAAAWLPVPAEPLAKRHSHHGWVKPAVTRAVGGGGYRGRLPIDNFHFPFRRRRIHMARIYQRLQRDPNTNRWNSPVERFLAGPILGLFSLTKCCRGAQCCQTWISIFWFPPLVPSTLSFKVAS